MNKCVRIIIDILMTVLLSILMAYSLVGEQAHEILGVLMFALFIAHHVINRKWWTGLFQRKIQCGSYFKHSRVLGPKRTSSYRNEGKERCMAWKIANGFRRFMVISDSAV